MHKHNALALAIHEYVTQSLSRTHPKIKHTSSIEIPRDCVSTKIEDLIYKQHTLQNVFAIAERKICLVRAI